MLKKSRFCDLANCKNTALLTCGKAVAGIKKIFIFQWYSRSTENKFSAVKSDILHLVL